jgi:hypothetical protein
LCQVIAVFLKHPFHHHAADPVNQPVMPSVSDIGRIKRDRVELVLQINLEFVAGAVSVIPVAVDAEITAKQTDL